MYVRWQSRKRRSAAYAYWSRSSGKSYREGDIHWRAILVENVRIDGKATQRHIAYLGGITESAIALEPPAQRMFFWDKVRDRLDGLGNKLSVKQRAAIEEAIAKKIPRVSRKERKQVERNRRELGF